MLALSILLIMIISWVIMRRFLSQIIPVIEKNLSIWALVEGMFSKIRANEYKVGIFSWNFLQNSELLQILVMRSSCKIKVLKKSICFSILILLLNIATCDSPCEEAPCEVPQKSPKEFFSVWVQNAERGVLQVVPSGSFLMKLPQTSLIALKPLLIYFSVYGVEMKCLKVVNLVIIATYKFFFEQGLILTPYQHAEGASISDRLNDCSMIDDGSDLWTLEMVLSRPFYNIYK